MSRPPQFFIFDMDDTLAVTSELWQRAKSEFLESAGHTWPSGLVSHYKGMNALDVAAVMHRRLGLEKPLEWYQWLLRELLIASFQKGPLIPMPGAEACLRLARKQASLALASGSPMEFLRPIRKIRDL